VSKIELASLTGSNTIVSICAAMSATCAYAVYNEDLYQPYDILAKWNTSPGGRAAMFLGALAWALSNVTNNITANSISAANDMCSLMPKYMDIKRGQMFVITIGVWGFVPWKVMNSASNFLAFMASYSIVLAPIAILMVVDFYVVKKKKYNIYEMYRPKGIYRYWKGWNWRAYVALICAIAPNLPGMVHAINSSIDIGNIQYVYMVSNLVGDTSEYRILVHSSL
jgi:NCS1 family nucleobase:cation symporter-1